MKKPAYDALVIGAGIIGIATGYYLKKLEPKLSVALVDSGQPMAFTSAQSGENYRNWWPHPVMTAFTNRSITLMEQIALKTGNRVNMTRGGYALTTRAADIDGLIRELYAGYAENGTDEIRFHDHGSKTRYEPPYKTDWRGAPAGVDVLRRRDLIEATFPSFVDDVRSVIHIRRAGSISSQQLGQYMLDEFRARGGQLISGEVKDIEPGGVYRVRLATPGSGIRAERIVNAAGPFTNAIAAMLGVELPTRNSVQQKVAFADVHGAIPRNMPFSIDLDPQRIDWSTEERELVAEDPEFARLTGEMPGAVHCRPDGGEQGSWVRLGWAFGEAGVAPLPQPPRSEFFPEIVLRGAARLNPSLKRYYGRLPRDMHHYSGYYTTTDENWPLIGELEVDGAYIVGAMSGFGTMAACAAGELCAQRIVGADLPEYARPLSLERYQDAKLLAEINALSSRGIL